MRYPVKLVLFSFLGLASCSQETMQERMFLLSKVDSSLKTQIQEISRALEKGNEEPEWFLKRARLYLAGGNQQAAFQDLSTATALNPSLGEAYFLQAKIQVARKEYQEAMKSMMQAKAFNYYTPESEAVLAQTYVGLALYEKALTPSARAVRLRPGEPTYYVLLARAQAGTGDTTRALYNLKRALQRDSTNLAAFRELSSIYTAQSRFEEAYPMVQAGVKQEPQDGFWWRRLGQVLLNQRLTDTAMATFAKAIDLEPKDAEAYAGIAEGWYKKRQYSLALENLLKAQELGLKLNDNTRWLLATCFEWTGQRELARQHYHLLVRKHPENPRYAAALQRITRPIRRTFIDTIAAKSVF